MAVTIEDQYGNVESGDSSTLTPSGPAGLVGNLSVPAVNGVATFSGLSINTAGNYTLTAGYNGTDHLSSVVSASFGSARRRRISAISPRVGHQLRERRRDISAGSIAARCPDSAR